MGNIPKEQQAAVRQGDGESAKAPLKTVPVPQEADLGPNDILVRPVA